MKSSPFFYVCRILLLFLFYVIVKGGISESSRQYEVDGVCQSADSLQQKKGKYSNK
jgi:hypothetical protein